MGIKLSEAPCCTLVEGEPMTTHYHEGNRRQPLPKVSKIIRKRCKGGIIILRVSLGVDFPSLKKTTWIAKKNER